MRTILSSAGCGRSVELWGVRLGEASGDPAQAELLRSFVRARNGDVVAAREMLIDTLRWRREMGVLSGHADVFPTQLLAEPDGGRPRIVLRADQIQPATFDDAQALVAWWVCMQEALLTHVFASPEARYTLVVDARGLGTHHFGRPARACAGELAAVMARYYPDMIGHTAVMHAPPWFSCCWAVVRPFLPRDFVHAVRCSPSSQPCPDHPNRCSTLWP